MGRLTSCDATVGCLGRIVNEQAIVKSVVDLTHFIIAYNIIVLFGFSLLNPGGGLHHAAIALRNVLALGEKMCVPTWYVRHLSKAAHPRVASAGISELTPLWRPVVVATGLTAV